MFHNTKDNVSSFQIICIFYNGKVLLAETLIADCIGHVYYIDHLSAFEKCTNKGDHNVPASSNVYNLCPKDLLSFTLLDALSSVSYAS